MTSKWMTGAGLLVLVAATTARAETIEKGKTFPDFKARCAVSGQQFSMEDLRGKVVLVDFWATWCGPCRMVAPIVKELAEDYADRGLKVGKLDVDANPRTAAQFGIRSIPTILFFKGGELVDKVIGAVPKPQLEERVQQHLG
jgi:thioredoxin 1